MKMKIALLLFTSFTTALLFAQSSSLPAPPLDAVKNFLALTDAQVNQLVQLRQQERTTLRPILQQLRIARQSLRKAMQAGDSATVTSTMATIKDLQSQIANTNSNFRTQAVAILTDAQKAKLQVLQDALNALPAARQAIGLNLLTPPAGLRAPGMLGPGPAGMGQPNRLGARLGAARMMRRKGAPN